MASIIKEILIDASPAKVWDAVRDVGAVHKRLARGFVVDTRLEGDSRIVTFANGLIARELIVDINHDLRRLVYASVGGRATHHNASMQVFVGAGGGTHLLWITDLLPNDLRPTISTLIDQGAAAMKRTLEDEIDAS